MDSRRQTRRKRASRSPGRWHLSSCYFLKQPNIDISQNVKCVSECFGAVGGSCVCSCVSIYDCRLVSERD
jgi:hypothetical protein